MTNGEMETVKCLGRLHTADVEAGKRHEYFADMVGRMHPGIEVKLPHCSEFEASLDAYAFSNSVLSRVSAPGHHANRGNRQIRYCPDEIFCLKLCEFAGFRAELAGTEWHLNPGMPFLVDTSTPFKLDFDHRRRMMLTTLMFDKKQLKLETSGLSLTTINAAISKTRAGQQLSVQMQLMSAATREGNLELANMMSQPVLTLLRMVITEASNRPAPGRLTLEDIKSAAACHIVNPDLDIGHLARIFNCTPRTIQSRFAQKDETFSRWLMCQRLELVRLRLRAPEYAGRSVESIAYSCGFQDSSHFHRAFKAYFGAPPGQLR